MLKKVSQQLTLPCDSGSGKLLICSIFTLGAKATGLTTPQKRSPLRGTPVSDVYFTFSSTKTRGVDIKGENEMDTSKRVAAHRLKKNHDTGNVLETTR